LLSNGRERTLIAWRKETIDWEGVEQSLQMINRLADELQQRTKKKEARHQDFGIKNHKRIKNLRKRQRKQEALASMGQSQIHVEAGVTSEEESLAIELLFA